MKLFVNHKYIVFVFVSFLIMFSLPSINDAAVTPVSDRTPQVRDAIVAAVPDITDAADVTETHLSEITSLLLFNKNITTLQAGDFDGLTSLQNLWLLNNELKTLPEGIFDDLTSLQVLYLNKNELEVLPEGIFAKLSSLRTLRLDKNELSVLPSGIFAGLLSLQRLYLFNNENNFLFPVALEEVSENNFKVVAPSGAPFDIVVPISVTKGSIANGVTEITIPTGTVESQPFTVLPKRSKKAVVTSGTLPTLPLLHNGYSLISATKLSKQIRSSINSVPEFTEGEMAIRSVDENTGPGVDIGTPIGATDADNDTLTYTLNGTDAASFGIDASSGQLRTNAPLDYEINSVYAVTITVSDGNSGSDTITVTINVNDVDEIVAEANTVNDVHEVPTNNVPVFTEDSTTTRSVDEHTSAGEDFGSAITATDADNDTLTYTLGGTDASSFSIDSSSGQLSTSAYFNYEEKSSYSVTVSVSDGNGGNAVITVDIFITDENDTPTFTEGSSTSRTIPENTGSGINIGSTVFATDEDGDNLTYSLGGTDFNSFSIESATGQLKTSESLDYEDKSSYSVTVSVSDSNGGSDSITVAISVTDLDETPSNNAPVFTEGSSATRAVAENTAAGQNIGNPIAATDADNNKLVWTLSGTDASAFSIDVNTGQLKTSAALNHETKSSYSVTVTVSDGGLSAAITVTVSVTDVNEAPVFTAGTSGNRTITENTAAGQNIGAAFTATDQDNDTLTYTLGGTDATAFSIVSTTGQLQTKAALDHETKSSYSVTITVSDGSLSDSIDVTITVTGANQNRAPVFTEGSSATRSVTENTGSGVNIGSAVSATDADNDTLTYTLGGTDASSFAIVSTSGQLQTKAALDYEIDTSYTVTVSVSDGNGGSDSITVTINVTDVDERTIASLLSGRTQQVRDAIVAAVPGVNNADDVTAVHLSVIDSLSLGSKGITSLKSGDFSGLTNLTRLYMGSNSISDISPLSGLTNLTSLYMRSNSISDISSLSGLTNLTTLYLQNNSISDISPLSGLTNLTSLNLDTNSISDISSLSGLTNLTTLYLQNNSISGISSLSGLTNLTTLFLDNNSISDISPLSGLTNLTDLSLHYNSASDISPLSGLTSLTTLYLQNNSISDTSPLSGLTNLTLLYLHSNSISDISPLEGLTNLTTLYMPHNSISDTSPLSGLTSLTTLSLYSNSVSDISSLSGLTNLTNLYLDSNSISDVSPLEGLTNLTTLWISRNPITDYAPLRRLVAAIKAAGGSLSLDITIPAAAPSHAAVPVSTSLLANYPNPFNPETWIPYQLAKPADVSISIYAVDGRLIRTIALGYKPAGFYQIRSRAAHWDGKNALGEKVAAGVYFYKFTAGNFSATRKMLIRK